MKTVIKEYKTYKFDELDETGKEQAIQNLPDIHVDYEWWQPTYDDAENVGLKITEFDLDRARHAKGKFLASAEETAHKIEKEHGESTETYKTAVSYLGERDETIDTAPRNTVTGELDDEGELDDKLDELDNEFLTSILEDYLIILQYEFEYLTSSEAIIETITANDYDFLENGKLF